MKSLVIYYSQTGNTKKIAQGIRKGIIGETVQCDLKRIRDVKPEDWLDYDLVGIGSAVWSSTPITNVVYHIKALPSEVKGKHAFFFCTHGILPGRCLIRGVQPMQEAGLTVIGWKDWYCGASLPGHAKPWFSDGHPDEIDLIEAEAFGKAMVRHSGKVAGGNTAILPTLPTPETSDMIYGIGHPFLFMGSPHAEDGESAPIPPRPAPAAETEPEPYPLEYPTTMDYVSKLEGIDNHEGMKGGPNDPLRINPDKCISCGRCAEACFCNNIDASVFPPRFRTQACERCFFCEGVCPTGALEYEFRPSSPEAMQRPGGSMSLALDLAEATGRFRRILDEKEVGYATPWETITTHPRHKEIP